MYSLEGEVSEVAGQTPEEVEVNFRESMDEADSRATTTTTIAMDEVVHEAEEDLAGRTMTSRREIAMRLSILNRTGRCLKRLISIVLPN